MPRLNSGKKRHNFFVRLIFYREKLEFKKLNNPDSGEINILCSFPGVEIAKNPGIQPIYAA